MPYIKKEHRVNALENPTNAGELNFALTESYRDMYSYFLETNSLMGKLTCADLIHDRMLELINTMLGNNDKNYQSYNDVAGALLLSIEEYKRRSNQLGFYNTEFNDLLKHASSKTLRIILESRINPYEDLKIKENGDVF